MKKKLNDQEIITRNSLNKKRKKTELPNNTGDDCSEKIHLCKRLKLIKKKNINSPSVEKAKYASCAVTNKYIKVAAHPTFNPRTPNIFSVLSSSENENHVSESISLYGILSKELFSKRNKFHPTKNPLKKITNGQTSKRVDSIKNYNYDKEEKKGTVKETKNSKVENPKENLTSSHECKKKNFFKNSNEMGCTLESSSYADFYEVSNANSFIFHLHHPCKFRFTGELKFTVITGQIEISGFQLNAFSKHQTIRAYSPKFYTSLVVETKTLENVPHLTKKEIKHNLESLLTEGKTKHLLENLKPDDTVVLVEQEISSFGSVISHYMALPLFPKDLINLSSMSESLKKLQSTFKFNSSVKEKEFRKSPHWDQLNFKKCSVFCGGKGVGKSTLLKYCTNKLVSEGEKVLVLDLDPGQPEFTPPGFISATVTDKPLLGPNFTHLNECNMMVYFGSVSTSQLPSKYLECVNSIIQWCRSNKETSEMKWLVNTMGFCKGLGVELMITVLKLLMPDSVVQLKSHNEQNNYPFDLTPDIVNGKMGFCNMPSEEKFLNYDYWKIQSIASMRHGKVKTGLMPAQLRDVVMVSYFSKMLNSPYEKFNCVQPYVVSFCSLYLGINFYIKPEYVLKAFNGNTVSLSHFTRSTEMILFKDLDAEEFFKIVLKPGPLPSFGLGFVRGIDFTKKKFYIITPLPLHELQKVNCLILGKMSSPNFMYVKQETIRKETVYTSTAGIQSTKKVQRVFRKFIKSNATT